MLYPKSIEDKLGFDQVVERAKSFCQSRLGLAHFDRVKYSANRELVSLWLAQTAEIKELIEHGDLSLSIEVDFDLQREKANIKGFFYELETIQQIQDLLYVLQKVHIFIAKNNEEYHQLSQLFANVDIDFSLIDAISRVLGPDGKIKPNASKALQTIISDIRKAERSIIKSSQSLFTSAKDKGLLGDTELGIKNGRVVLPVLSEHKRKINGVLIDQSGTGKISYIEPMELVSLNNELAELQIKKRQEIIAILKKLTQEIVVYIDDLKKGQNKLGVFDFIRAKARLASEWKCVLPTLGSSTEVEQAAHPLLHERLKTEGQSIVPLSYQLHNDQRLIIISGPNAGGKSVALKTMGLLQYMFQSGFLVPCEENSTFRIFNNLFIDIGDDQSIESDLSTYSSHLKAAKHIINFCDAHTMVLMDEIGTGTDPMFGGPMAEAILEEVHRKQAQGIVTTHFSNIKTRADKLEGAVNAAMMFDIENLVPLYILQIGQPGSSFVYEVAANIGLNKKIIKRAKKLTNTKQYDLDALLAEVQNKQKALDIATAEIDEKTKHAEMVESEYKQMKQMLETEKKKILEQAKLEANHIIKSANKDIENTIREIKENQANKKKTKQVREKLNEKLEDAPEEKVKKQTLEVGDRVQIEGTTTVGEIVEIRKNRAVLSVGSITTKTNVSKLSKVGQKTAAKVKKYISTRSYNDKQTSFRPEMDVRGMRTYDALAEVDKWLDSAIILGVGVLRLLHGKGNGILKNEVRRHLKGHPAIDKITYERVDLGGEGISIITLR